MGITFGYRSNQFNARFAPQGKEPGLMHDNSLNLPAIETDATAIGGKRLNLVDGTNTQSLLFLGAGNVPATKEISFLSKVWVPNENLNWKKQLFGIGAPTRVTQANHASLYYLHDSSQFFFRVGQERGLLSSLNISDTMTLEAWHDIVCTWDGTSNANSMKVYVDGVLIGQDAATTGWDNESGRENKVCPYIALGTGTFQTGEISGIMYNEFVIWDEVIDPTNVMLTGGMGSLNGAARTEFVEVEESPTPVFPGTSNVRDGVTYGSEGDNLTGSLDLPAEEDVRESTLYDNESKTGTLDLPAENDVRVGVDYDNETKSGNLDVIKFSVSGLTVDAGNNKATLESEVE